MYLDHNVTSFYKSTTEVYKAISDSLENYKIINCIVYQVPYLHY